jgi:hypothetical protein
MNCLRFLETFEEKPHLWTSSFYGVFLMYKKKKYHVTQDILQNGSMKRFINLKMWPFVFCKIYTKYTYRLTAAPETKSYFEDFACYNFITYPTPEIFSHKFGNT